MRYYLQNKNRQKPNRTKRSDVISRLNVFPFLLVRKKIIIPQVIDIHNSNRYVK